MTPKCIHPSCNRTHSAGFRLSRAPDGWRCQEHLHSDNQQSDIIPLHSDTTVLPRGHILNVLESAYRKGWITENQGKDLLSQILAKQMLTRKVRSLDRPLTGREAAKS